jgi:DNA-binding MarR family transcriptional regulator
MIYLLQMQVLHMQLLQVCEKFRIIIFMKEKATAKPRAQEVRENSIGWMLKSLSFSLDNEMKEELSGLGLTFGQFGLLMTLLEEDGLTQTEIGKKIAMPGYTTTRTLDALEEKHLIERRKDERSRRSHRIYLTGQGRKLGPKLYAIVKAVNEGLLASLSSAERADLISLLRRLLDSKSATLRFDKLGK